MKNSKVKFLLLIVSLLIFISPAIVNAKSFVVHFYYDDKAESLHFDKLKSEEVSLDKKSFTSQIDFLQESGKTEKGDYTIILYDTQGSKIGQSQFNVKSGAFDVIIPFFPFSGSVKVINSKNQQEILSSDLNKFSSCNANGICELEKKENTGDCLVDCGTSKIIYSEETKKNLRENNGVVKDSDTGEILIQDKSFFSSEANAFLDQKKNEALSTPDLANESNQANSSSTNSINDKNTGLIYYILLALLIAIVVFAVIVVLRKIRKKDGNRV